MTNPAGRRSLHRSFLDRSLVSASVVVLVGVAMFAALSTCSFADDGPKPDPAGIATGDTTTAVDAAGNPFVVPEPTDKNAPDYAANKKAFAEYQARAAKERSQ